MSIINLTLNELKRYDEVEIEDSFIQFSWVQNRKIGSIYIDLDSYTIYDEKYNKIDKKYLTIVEGYTSEFPNTPIYFEISEDYTLPEPEDYYSKCYIVSKKTYENEKLNNNYKINDNLYELEEELTGEIEDLQENSFNPEGIEKVIYPLNDFGVDLGLWTRHFKDFYVKKIYSTDNIESANNLVLKQGTSTNRVYCNYSDMIKIKDVTNNVYKQKRIIGTTGENQGDVVTVPHNFSNPNNIIGLQCIVRNADGCGVIPSTSRTNYEYEVRYDSDNIILELKTDNSDYLTSKPFEVVLTYK